ncbi:Uncharacterised protein [Mycobacteroides abscessus subsp. abscessus]|nr:Uncharacterised protein [Mycobacteroides abscessus subsp. abscessus]
MFQHLHDRMFQFLHHWLQSNQWVPLGGWVPLLLMLGASFLVIYQVRQIPPSLKRLAFGPSNRTRDYLLGLLDCAAMAVIALGLPYFLPIIAAPDAPITDLQHVATTATWVVFHALCLATGAVALGILVVIAGLWIRQLLGKSLPPTQPDDFSVVPHVSGLTTMTESAANNQRTLKLIEGQNIERISEIRTLVNHEDSRS